VVISHPSIERSQQRRNVVLGVLCLSLVIVVVGNISLNIAIPRLGEDLHASFSSLQWMVDIYSLFFAGLLLPAGALGDRFGRKGALQGGLAVFGLASLAAVFATEPWEVIAARGVMGFAAAFVMPGTLSLLAAVFPPAERHRAIAIWAGVAGASVAVGMLWSGLLLEHYSWGSVFLTNVFVVAVALALGRFLLPQSSDPSHTSLDTVGAVLSVAALSAVLYAVIEAPVNGWTDPPILICFVAFAVIGYAFVRWELHTPKPMLDLSYFRDPRFRVGCLSIVGAFLSLFGVYFLLTQYLQLVRNYSPLQAGVYTLPAGIAQMLTAPPSAALVERYGYRRIMVLGLVLVGAGMGLLAFLSLTSPLWILFLGLVLLGLGVGLATAPATGAIIASLPLRKAGVGSAVNDTTRELGGAIGVAILGSLLGSRFHHDIASATAHLSPHAAGTVRQGIGPALTVAQKLGGAPGQRLGEASRQAFSNGILLALWVGAAITFLSAYAVYRTLPAGLKPAKEDHDTEQAGAAVEVAETSR
jgi:EmrB/QacA subfamily drug resistance transporter